MAGTQTIYLNRSRHPGLSVRQWANLATLLFVAWCAIVYVRTNILTPLPGLASMSDFGVYHQAARDVARGISPYQSPAFFYPPLVAFLMAPFAAIDYVTARSVWFVLSHLMMLGSAWLLWRAWGSGRLALCCISAVWAMGGALKETLDVGQVTPLLLLALVVTLTSRSYLQGASVGFGFALKYIPGVMAPAVLLHRGWRAFAALVATAALGVLIPWAIVVGFFSGAKAPVAAHYWMGTPALFSWSLPSIVLRMLIPLQTGPTIPIEWSQGNVAVFLHLTPELRWISVSVALLTLAIGLTALVIRCRGKLSDADMPWAIVALISLSLVAAPVCWSHYNVLQYPGIALLLVHSIRTSAWRSAAAVIFSAWMLHPWPQKFLADYYNLHGAWTAYSPATLYFWTSVSTLASLVVFGLALSHVRGKQKAQVVPIDALSDVRALQLNSR